MTVVASVTHAGLRRALKVPPAERIPEGRYVELPGRGRVYVTDVPGPTADAPVVVLLHALSTTAALAWYPVLGEVAKDHRVIAFDQRWHGRGIRSRHFRLEDCADDVAALLDALGVRDAVLVGYSMGGMVAQLVWKRHRSRVRGLVLCSTARNFRCARRERVFFPLLSAAMTPLHPYVHGRVQRYAETLPELPSCDALDVSVWGRAEFRATSAWSAPHVLAEIGRFNSAPWIGEVDVPTAVVVTERDRAIPARRQLRLAECIPGAEVFRIPSGHAALVLDAERFRPALDAALASVESRASLPRLRGRRRA